MVNIKLEMICSPKCIFVLFSVDKVGSKTRPIFISLFNCRIVFSHSASCKIFFSLSFYRHASVCDRASLVHGDSAATQIWGGGWWIDRVTDMNMLKVYVPSSFINSSVRTTGLNNAH